MSEIIYQEAEFFAASFVWGILLILLYDILRVLRRSWIHSKGAVALEDLLFWLLSGLMIFRMMYEKNDGIIRGTAFFSMGLGMVFYHGTISRYVVSWGYRFIGKPIKKICIFFDKGLKNVQKKGKLLMRRVRNLEAEEGQHDKKTKR